MVSVVSKKVNRSIELPDGSRCVDIFEREDGAFGFEEYRQDPESNSGWFPIGNYSSLIMGSERDALEEALIRIPWLKGFIR